MSANINPLFTLSGNMIGATTSIGTTASDGSSNLTVLLTAGVNGSRIDGVKSTNMQLSYAASTAMTIKVFISNAAGTGYVLISEAALPAATRSASVVGTTVTQTFSNPIILLSGQKIAVAQSIYNGAQDLTGHVCYGADF